MRRPRFTLRSAMIAVAVAALVPRGYTLWRSVRFAAKAQEFQSKSERRSHTSHDVRCLGWERSGLHRGNVSIHRRRASHTAHDISGLLYSRKLHELHREWEKRWKEHYRSLALKYRSAPRFPWMPVDPDPPEPAQPADPPLRPQRARPKSRNPTSPTHPILTD